MWLGGQSQAAGQDKQQLPPSLLGLFSRGEKRARAGQVRCLQGSPLRVPAHLHREGGIAALPARRSPRGRFFAAREHFPAVLSLAVPGSPFLFFFFLFLIALKIKHPLGAIETAGRLSVCNPPRTSPGWGRAARAELERAARPAAAEDWLRGGREPNIYVIF